MNDAELCWIIVICMLFIYSSAPPPGSYSSVSRFLVAMLQTCLLYYYFITYLPLILISIYWYQFVIFFALSTPIAQFVIAISASKQTPIVTFFLRLVTTFAPPLLSFEFFFSWNLIKEQQILLRTTTQSIFYINHKDSLCLNTFNANKLCKQQFSLFSLSFYL